MKRFIALIAMTAFAAGAALAATPAKTAKHVPVKGEEYHHLLMLDVREAAEHAKTLRYYAQAHTRHMDRTVVMKHVDELTKNLDGVREELGKLEQNIEAKDKTLVDTHLATIQSEEQTARQNLDVLKTEAAKDTPDASVIAEKSKAIYAAMTTADEHHRRAMVKRGVQEPPKS